MIMRYPGGKSKLISEIGKFLDPLLIECDIYTEPFVGGGSVALHAAKKNDGMILHLNDLDSGISSFWKIVVDGDLDSLFKLMRRHPSVRLFKELRDSTPVDVVDKAYKALFLNRCAFSGISTSGPIGGYDQKSEWKIGCRYNYVRLKKEIEEAHELLRDRTVVTGIDFRKVMNNDGLYYVDAPYYTKGDQLYPVKMLHKDHVVLMYILQGNDNWVASYDQCKEIRELYSWAKIIPIKAGYSINGIKKSWKRSKECIIIPK